MLNYFSLFTTFFFAYCFFFFNIAFNMQQEWHAWISTRKIFQRTTANVGLISVGTCAFFFLLPKIYYVLLLNGRLFWCSNHFSAWFVRLIKIVCSVERGQTLNDSYLESYIFIRLTIRSVRSLQSVFLFQTTMQHIYVAWVLSHSYQLCWELKTALF